VFSFSSRQNGNVATPNFKQQRCAEIVDDIGAASFAIRQSETILAAFDTSGRLTKHEPSNTFQPFRCGLIEDCHDNSVLRFSPIELIRSLEHDTIKGPAPIAA
jgi:hypothetical protein